MNETAPIVDLLLHLLDGGVAMLDAMNTASKDGADLNQPERALTQGSRRIVRLEQHYYLRCSTRAMSGIHSGSGHARTHADAESASSP